LWNFEGLLWIIELQKLFLIYFALLNIFLRIFNTSTKNISMGGWQVFSRYGREQNLVSTFRDILLKLARPVFNGLISKVSKIFTSHKNLVLVKKGSVLVEQSPSRFVNIVEFLDKSQLVFKFHFQNIYGLGLVLVLNWTQVWDCLYPCWIKSD
jgi:hypothetical protein